VEDKKAECDRTEDNDMYESIRQELLEYEDTKALSEDEIGKLVSEDFDEWKTSHDNHRTRLADTISTLLDIFSSVYHVEARDIYRYYINGEENLRNITAEGDEEPSWKREADKQIERMERERRKKEEKKQAQDDSIYRLDYTSDAEDLDNFSSSTNDDNKDNSDSEDSYSQMRASWRQSRCLASKEDIAIARADEDQRLSERGARLRVRSDAEDRKDTVGWVETLRPPRSRVSSNSLSKRRRSTSSRAVPRRGSAAVKAPPVHSSKEHDYSSQSDDEISIVEVEQSVPGVKHEAVSPLVLSKDPPIVVDSRFTKDLKQHQKEGIEFIFRNSFADLGDQVDDDKKTEIGGCIVAHSMVGIILIDVYPLNSVERVSNNTYFCFVRVSGKHSPQLH
jgi:hypothetical protein